MCTDVPMTARNKTICGIPKGFTCSTPPYSSQGPLRFSGDNACTMKIMINLVAQGGLTSVTVAASGKRLGDDLGLVQLRPPKIAVPTRTIVLPD